MPRYCSLCGTPHPGGDSTGEDSICSHHITTDVDWAVANRVFCDLLHRRIEPAPVFSNDPNCAEVLLIESSPVPNNNPDYRDVA